MNFSVTTPFLAAAVLLPAMWYDIRTSRIPNWLTLGSSGIIFIFYFFQSGGAGLLDSFLGATIGGGVWFILWAHNFAGGGDQKLMIAVGAILGSQLIVFAIFFIALAGGAQALITILYNKMALASPPQLSWKKLPLPYSVAITIGTFFTIICQWVGLPFAW